MSDELLTQYQRELGFIRKQAEQFARDHPRIAERLRLGGDVADDPHVERLIQAFAFLSGRVRQKLDDDFPELTESLLGVLYPHYQAPIPSLAVAQMHLPAEQKDLPRGYRVQAQTTVETEPIEGEPCRFRTTSPVTLWPLAVQAASLSRPKTLTEVVTATLPKAVLHLSLEATGDGGSFKAMELDELRFFLHGQGQHVYQLYELIFNHTTDVVLAASPRDPDALVLDPRQCLEPGGFGRDEGVLPYGPRSFLGYRILTEFFAFPQKFLFVHLKQLARRRPAVDARLEVYLYLDRATPDLEQFVTRDTFRLGCTPVVNLYRQKADPIPLSHDGFEYHVIPDSRRPLVHEVYSIDKVTASSNSGEQAEYHAFFSVKHADDRERKTFWHANRRPAESASGGIDPGTEVHLAVVDLELKPAAADGWTLDIDTTCLNRDRPNRLSYGGDELPLQITSGAGLVKRMHSLTAFTPTLRPPQGRGALWRLISHLSLNHLSLVDGDEPAHGLREILTLYDFTRSPQVQKLIGGVKAVEAERVVGRVGGSTFCRGVEVRVTFDKAAFSSHELFLFATVLERFFALYCTMNSFTKMVARVDDGKQVRELREWQPRIGERVLL